MNDLEKVAQIEGYKKEFNRLFASILINKESAIYYAKLLTCKYLFPYEEIVLERVNKYSSKIDRLPTLDFCIGDNLIEVIPPEQLYSTDILKDKLDLFLKQREELFSSEELNLLSKQIAESGVPKNALDRVTKALATTRNLNYSDGVDEFEENYKNKDLSLGFRTGVDYIDGTTGGLQLGTVNTILGFTGSGKTTWAVNIGYLAALEKRNVAYISLEIPKHLLLCDLLSRHSNDPSLKEKLEHRHIKHRKLNDRQEDILWKTILPDFKEKISKHFKIIDESDIREYSTTCFLEILEEIDKRFQKETGKGIELLFIDHIQLLKASNTQKTNDLKEIVNLFVSFFRQQAVGFLHTKRPICIVLLSQANRDGWKYACREKGKYQLTALAEANELERASSIVLSIFTSDVLMQCKDARVMVLKSRDGALMEEPISTYIDPTTYIVGDVVGEVGQGFSSIDMNEILGSSTYDPALNQLMSSAPDLSTLSAEDIMNL